MPDKAPPLFEKLAEPAPRALANAGFNTWEQLSQLTEAELMQLHGIGKIALQIIKADMVKHQISFKTKE